MATEWGIDLKTNNLPLKQIQGTNHHVAYSFSSQKGDYDMKYNLSKIMLKAWKVYRSGKQISFGEALHRAC